MNDDIKNARSILVKLPEDKGFFSWINGYLYSLEGKTEMLKSKVLSFLLIEILNFPNYFYRIFRFPTSKLLDRF